MPFGPKQTGGKFNVNPSAISTPLVWFDAETGVTSGGDNTAVTAVINQCSAPVIGGPSNLYTSGVPYRGICVAGAEYGDEFDGWTGNTYYDIASGGGGGGGSPTRFAGILSYLTLKGFNTIHIPISWERLQRTLGGAFDASYSSQIVTEVTQATTANFNVIVDLHAYDRYAEGAFNGSGVQVGTYTQRVLGDGTLTTAHVLDVWSKLANLFKDNSKVIFELMNESHDVQNMTSTQYFDHINTLISTIRNTGATNLLLVPNTRGSDLDHFVGRNAYPSIPGPVDGVAALAVTDSLNNFAFDLHAYWWPAGGTPGYVEANYTSYTDYLSDITAWAKAQTPKRKLWLTEMGSNEPDYNTQVTNALTFMNNNSDVWQGWTPWNLPSNGAVTVLTNDPMTADGPAMPTFAPFLTPNIVSGG